MKQFSQLEQFAKTIVRNRGSLADARNANMIDEIVADGVSKAWLKGIQPSDPAVRGYVFYAALQHIQKRGKAGSRKIVLQPLETASEVKDSAPPPTAALEAAETLQGLLGAVGRLPPALKVVTMHQLEGMSVEESATILKVKANTVRVSRCRAVIALRDLMGVTV